MRKQALEPVVGQLMSRSAKETPPVVTHVTAGVRRVLGEHNTSPQSAAGAAPRMHTVYAGTPLCRWADGRYQLLATGLPVIRHLLPPTRVLKVGCQDLKTLLRHVERGASGGVGVRQLSAEAQRCVQALDAGMCVVSYDGDGPRQKASDGVPCELVGSYETTAGGGGKCVVVVVSREEAGVLLKTRLPPEQKVVGAPLDSSAAYAGRPGGSGEWREDWVCPRCEAACFGSKAFCYQCRTPNPALSEAGGRTLGAGGSADGFGQPRWPDGAKTHSSPPDSTPARVALLEQECSTGDGAGTGAGGEKRARGQRGGRRVKEAKEKASLQTVPGPAPSGGSGGTVPANAMSAMRASLLAGVRLKK